MKLQVSSRGAAIKVGFFLALRELKRSNKWTTGLIIFIMTLTFLNLIAVRGILVGLTQGSVDAFRNRYSGDIIFNTPREKTFIADSGRIRLLLEQTPHVSAVSSRYITPASLQSGYRTQVRFQDALETASGQLIGIQPQNENKVTNLASALIEGEYLRVEDIDYVVVGKNLLSKYAGFDSPTVRTLRDVGVGSKVRLIVNGNIREVTIKGVVGAKVQSIDQAIFMVDRQVQQLMERNDFNANEIAVKLQDGFSVDATKNYFIANGASKSATVRTFEEAIPQFVKDIQQTFAILGNLIGSIGLVVSCITIFILIFVNAITRRKYIGILKGIGVSGLAIEISYVIQSVFYAVIGTVIASLIVFLFLKPYFATNPINFPFSDGILVADVDDVLLRGVLLILATIVAGYIPAWLVVRQKTLDAILGR